MAASGGHWKGGNFVNRQSRLTAARAVGAEVEKETYQLIRNAGFYGFNEGFSRASGRIKGLQATARAFTDASSRDRGKFGYGRTWDEINFESDTGGRIRRLQKAIAYNRFGLAPTKGDK